VKGLRQIVTKRKTHRCQREGPARRGRLLLPEQDAHAL
jgi:hypothetical protein